MIDQSRLPVTNIDINISSIIPMKNKIPSSIAYPPDLILYTSYKTTPNFCQTAAHPKRKCPNSLNNAYIWSITSRIF